MDGHMDYVLSKFLTSGNPTSKDPVTEVREGSQQLQLSAFILRRISGYGNSMLISGGLLLSQVIC